VPALLLVAFSLLCGFLLFYSFSSYLVQSRLRAPQRGGRASSRRARALEIQRAGGRDVPAILGAAPGPTPPSSIPKCRWARGAGEPQLRRWTGTQNSKLRTENYQGWAVDARGSALAACQHGSTVRDSRACSPTRIAGPWGNPGEETHLMVAVGGVFPTCRARDTRWSSICWSTTRSVSSCARTTGVELKSVTRGSPAKKDDDAAGRSPDGPAAMKGRGGPLATPGSAQQPHQLHRLTATGPPGASGPMTVTQRAEHPRALRSDLGGPRAASAAPWGRGCSSCCSRSAPCS